MVDRRRRRLLAATGSVGLFGLAGCSSGGDSDDDPDGTPAGDTQSGDSGDQTDDTSGTNGADDSSGTDEYAPDIPDEYILHLVPDRNEELRQQVPDDQLERYREEFGTDLIEDSNVFADDPGEEWRQMEVDLLALEWWHDNDYLNIQHEEGSQFVESIGTDSPEESIECEAKNTPPLVRYPNSEGESNTYGHFDYQEFTQTESVGEALDWLQKYLFNWQMLHDDPGPISTEDELYAAALQECLDAHTDIESHCWALDLPEASASTHGNGLIYDATNNELRVMETINGPETQTAGSTDEQYHPLGEDSNYLDPSHEAYDSWWHPLRFADDHQQDTVEGHESLDFETRKKSVASTLMDIATGADEDVEIGSLTDVGITTQYLVDFTGKLADWNQNEEYDGELFEEIKKTSPKSTTN
ncbi:hypothetical protein L593_11245 [Salinarchaeum sp. Harcht-Bsk1]|uniref:hypothetical protein n=1 Tax=Salinarchaeum sp. Harcht-Bsk1 TaxID=1333523 RepID=UPI0003424506|nr:hypothetical protein [Salinarchaeum sp. Harcht-Bsk1]AGN02194.1 hypothetical protein L593_11245 [Salinarchaeum sp. Harcht-Bsk1]